MHVRFYLGWGVLFAAIFVLGLVATFAGRYEPQADPTLEEMMSQKVLDRDLNPRAPRLDPTRYYFGPKPHLCSYYEQGDYRDGRIYDFVVIKYCTGPNTTHPEYEAWRRAIDEGYFVAAVFGEDDYVQPIAP